MTPELLQLIVQGGGFALAVWMLNNVWTELKVQNERIYQLLLDREQAQQERADLMAQMQEVRSAIKQRNDGGTGLGTYPSGQTRKPN